VGAAWLAPGVRNATPSDVVAAVAAASIAFTTFGWARLISSFFFKETSAFRQ
jgi:hypothetical protein